MHFHLADLIGAPVHDLDGHVLGRIFDVRAEDRDGELEIVEYHVGTAAMLHRVGLSALHLVGVNRFSPRRIPWDQLDVSDPRRPVLRDASAA